MTKQVRKGENTMGEKEKKERRTHEIYERKEHQSQISIYKLTQLEDNNLIYVNILIFNQRYL